MLVDETAFVAKALKESIRHSDILHAGKPFSQHTNWEAYRFCNPLVNDLLTKAQVLVARRLHKALGFVLYQEEAGICLVWVYVRSSERRNGTAKALLDAALGQMSPDAALESFFPTTRWRTLSESYGFFVPDTI